MNKRRQNTTLQSRSSVGDFNPLADLRDMYDIIEDFGESPESSFAVSLMDSQRYLDLAEDVSLRLGKPTAKPGSCRLYLLNDLLIIGKYKNKKLSKQTITRARGTSTMNKTSKNSLTSAMTEDDGEQIVFGNANNLGWDVDDEDALSEMTKKGPQKKRSKLKMKMWVELHGVQVIDLHRGDDYGLQVIFTEKETLEDEETGEIEYVTNVHQTEFFFADEATMTHFSDRIRDVIDEILQNEIAMIEDEGRDSVYSNVGKSTRGGFEGLSNGGGTARASVFSTASSKTSGKKRTFARGKQQMKQNQRARNKNRGRNNSTMGRNGTAANLSMIEERYKTLKPSEQETPKANVGLAVFSVSFTEGMMGFALSSLKSDNKGVFVGQIQTNGMADLGGVTIGDKVVQVQKVKIEDSFGWQQAKEIVVQERMKAAAEDKPLVIKFSRNEKDDQEVKRQQELAKKKEEEERKARIAKRREKRGGRRKWFESRKNKKFGNQLNTLKDLEAKYTGEKAAKTRKEESAQDDVEDVFVHLVENSKNQGGTDAEIKCIYVMKEIHDTEKDYIHSLFQIRDIYIKRLSKRNRNVLCRVLHLSSGNSSAFCEHKISPAQCEQDSSVKAPLLTFDQKKQVFLNLESLVDINITMLQKLQDGLLKLAKDESMSVSRKVNALINLFAQTFREVMPYFRLYGYYASRYGGALDTLNELRIMNPKLDSELKDIGSRRHMQSLNSLLHKPIGRLCKYPLLFKELDKTARKAWAAEMNKVVEGDAKAIANTEVDELEVVLENLEAAKDIVNNIAQTVDLDAGNNSRSNQMRQIFADIGGVKYLKEFFIASRKYENSFEVLKIQEVGQKSMEMNCVMFLFNDMMIIAKKNFEFDVFKGLENAGGKFGDGMSTVDGGRSKSDASFMKHRNKTKNKNFLSKIGLKRGQEEIPPLTMLVNTPLLPNVRAKKIPRPKENLWGAKFFISVDLAALQRQQKKKFKKKKKAAPGPVDKKTSKPVIKCYMVFFKDKKERDDVVAAVDVFKENLKIREKDKNEAKKALANTEMFRDRIYRKQKGQDQGLHKNRLETLRQKRDQIKQERRRN